MLHCRKAGITKKRYKGLDQPPRYISPTLTYNYQRDYSLKAGQRVSILTLQGRVVVSYSGYHKHVAIIQHGATIKAGRLWYDKQHKQFYLFVLREQEVLTRHQRGTSGYPRRRCRSTLPCGDRYCIRRESIFFRQNGQGESRPLRPATKTTSSEKALAPLRDNLCRPERTRETVEAE